MEGAGRQLHARSSARPALRAGFTSVDAYNGCLSMYCAHVTRCMYIRLAGGPSKPPRAGKLPRKMAWAAHGHGPVSHHGPEGDGSDALDALDALDGLDALDAFDDEGGTCWDEEGCGVEGGGGRWELRVGGAEAADGGASTPASTASGFVLVLPPGSDGGTGSAAGMLTASVGGAATPAVLVHPASAAAGAAAAATLASAALALRAAGAGLAGPAMLRRGGGVGGVGGGPAGGGRAYELDLGALIERQLRAHSEAREGRLAGLRAEGARQLAAGAAGGGNVVTITNWTVTPRVRSALSALLAGGGSQPPVGGARAAALPPPSALLPPWAGASAYKGATRRRYGQLPRRGSRKEEGEDDGGRAPTPPAGAPTRPHPAWPPAPDAAPSLAGSSAASDDGFLLV
jgi:hypothetical protein